MFRRPCIDSGPILCPAGWAKSEKRSFILALDDNQKLDASQTGFFFLQVVLISASGVMAPGPVTAATLAAGARSRHAGALIAVGHGIVEFPLMFLIIAGMDRMLASEPAQIGIGLAGGILLLLMAIGMLRSVKTLDSSAAAPGTTSALWTGIALTGGNPYFLLWWATVGLTLATEASHLGVMAFVAFAVVHWLCDLIWLEVLSLTGHKGSVLLGQRFQRIVLLVCSFVLIGFAAKFLFASTGDLLRIVTS